MNNWLFKEERNLGVITVASIMEGKKTILYVSHDIEDGAWQFLTGEIPKEEEARILLLEEIVELDPSVSELADLPMGWFAERQNKNEPWSRTKKE